jgi:hypothetical protein
MAAPTIPTGITLAQLIDLRDRLIQERIGGVKEIRDAFRSTVIYKDDVEMERAITSVTEMIVAMTAGAPVTTIRFRTSKGLGHLDRRFGWYGY